MRKSGLIIRSAFLLLVVTGSANAQSMRSGGQTGSVQQGFGASVVVASGGIFVGESANQSTPGSVYAYGHDDSDRWTQMAKLVSPDAENGDGFGGALAVEDRTLVTSSTSADGGAGAVYPAGTPVAASASTTATS